MIHDKRQDDFFYELRPYFIMILGVIGLFNKSLFGTSQGLNILGFFCSIALMGIGALVISMRKEYRKARAAKKLRANRY